MKLFEGPLQSFHGRYRDQWVKLSFQVTMREVTSAEVIAGEQPSYQFHIKVGEKFYLDDTEITKEEAQAVYSELKLTKIERGSNG